MAFDGLRVLSLESRRSAEMERLIRNQGGIPFVAPSLREVPLEDNPEAFDFAARLFQPGGDFDMVIFLTGVGARLLNQILETRYPPGAFIDALRRVAVVVRGSKPAAVMREWGVPIALSVPEPNTWREVLKATEDRPERRIAIQEFGRTSEELIGGLRARVAEVEGLESEVRRALARIVVALVGPSTSETLRELGIEPDLEPSHPKMGF